MATIPDPLQASAPTLPFPPRLQILEWPTDFQWWELQPRGPVSAAGDWSGDVRGAREPRWQPATMDLGRAWAGLELRGFAVEMHLALGPAVFSGEGVQRVAPHALTVTGDVWIDGPTEYSWHGAALQLGRPGSPLWATLELCYLAPDHAPTLALHGPHLALDPATVRRGQRLLSLLQTLKLPPIGRPRLENDPNHAFRKTVRDAERIKQREPLLTWGQVAARLDVTPDQLKEWRRRARLASNAEIRDL